MHGILYTDKNGNIQKGLVKDIDQLEAFKKVKKAYIRLVNDDLTIKIDEVTGKGLVSLKNIDSLECIGFID
jgi:hypothetical protein